MPIRPDDTESRPPTPRAADPAAATLLPPSPNASAAATGPYHAADPAAATLLPSPSDTAGPSPTPPLPSPPGYEIVRELGRGSMGVVCLARQLGFNRLVALKMILSGPYAADEERERFRIEAEAIASVQHPNIIHVYEVGEHDGRPFFSMEFCPAGALDGKLKATPLPPAEAAALVEALARALHVAHERGVVHRDLKPGNVLLADDGTPKVTDFGLAKRMDGSGQTQSGAVMGTPCYMAPEQAAGKVKEVGPAADVYALGAILYECLTGRPPFKGPTALDTLHQLLSDEAVRPRQLQPRTPVELEAICLKCLEKEPGRRYATAAELAEDLGRWRRGEPVRARPVGGWERSLKWMRRHRLQTAVYGLVLAALVLGLGGGGATWLWLKAEGAKGEAEAARLRADSAKGEAEAARLRAETAEGKAETARHDVEAARDALKGALRREQDAKRQLTEYSYVDRVHLAQSEWDAGQVEQAQAQLKEAAALREELTPGRRPRPWEWEHLNRVLHPEAAVLEGHLGSVSSVAFSPDGRRVATASGDGTARVWDAASGKSLAVLQGHAGWVIAVVFSPDGARVATASFDNTARVWDAASGKSLAVLQGHTGIVYSVAFSPDGARVATASEDKTARVWDVASGKQLAVLQGHTDSVHSAAFSPDGGRVATASFDRTARLWDAASGKQLAVLAGHTSYIDSAVFSPDGARLATASEDNTARLWDAASGKPLAVLEGHTHVVTSVCFSPDGSRMATASQDGTARLWIGEESQEDQEKREQEQHRQWRERQAADAEQAGQWFAAAFHLNRILKDDPNNADLLHRRDAAEAHLVEPVARCLSWQHLLAESISVTFTNGADAPVIFSLSDSPGRKLSLKPKETLTYLTVVDAPVQPLVLIDQRDGGALAFAVENHGDYAIIRDKDGRLMAAYKTPPKP